MLKIIILLVLLTWAVWAFSSLERRTLYYPDKQIAATPAVYQLKFEEVVLRTVDRVQIHGWFVPGNPKHKSDLTLLFFHGNAGNISHRLDKLRMFHEQGLNVFIVDYRGYGKSAGTPSEQGTYRDGSAAYRFLTQDRHVPAEQIVLYGESLGCAVAIEMGRRYPAAALILESPFTSTVAMGKLVYPWLPVQWMVHYRYDNLSKIPNIHLPLLVMHSSTDEIVPFAMGQQLYAAAPGPKTFFQLSGGHNDGYDVTGKSYIEAIATFLKGISK